MYSYCIRSRGRFWPCYCPQVNFLLEIKKKVSGLFMLELQINEAILLTGNKFCTIMLNNTVFH